MAPISMAIPAIASRNTRVANSSGPYCLPMAMRLPSTGCATPVPEPDGSSATVNVEASPSATNVHQTMGRIALAHDPRHPPEDTLAATLHGSSLRRSNTPWTWRHGVAQDVLAQLERLFGSHVYSDQLHQVQKISREGRGRALIIL